MRLGFDMKHQFEATICTNWKNCRVPENLLTRFGPIHGFRDSAPVRKMHGYC